MADTMEKTVNITDSAARRIAYLMSKEENPNAKLRVAVDGGGCSGFQYSFDLTDALNDDDIVIEKDGAVVLVDAMSLDYMGGAVIDYVETLGAAHFEVKNPNATANCGCGNSFSI